jgi:hypothetical protein
MGNRQKSEERKRKKPMKTIVYDCEVLKIPESKGEKDPSLSYCQGWRDFKNLGLSAICCWVSEGFSLVTGLHSFTNFDDSIPGSLTALVGSGDWEIFTTDRCPVFSIAPNPILELPALP